MTQKPERYYRKFTVTKIEGTAKQPYVLDAMEFGVINGTNVCALYPHKDGSIENVVTGEKLTYEQYLELTDNKTKDNFQYIGGYDVRNMLEDLPVKSLFSLKFNFRLKENQSGKYIESAWAPAINMRASQRQVCLIVNDLQRSLNKQLKKEQKQSQPEN